MKFYLITGFLGAGKTTFLKRLIHSLSGQRMHVIVNEFGSQGVDGAILAQTGAAVDEISNGSIFCTCRFDQFETALTNAVNSSPDIIIVEASGLSDPTAIGKILRTNALFASAIAYKGSICLVDASRFEKVVSTALVCKKQVAAADLILVNKTDLVGEEKLRQVDALLRACCRQDARIVHTSFGKFEPRWLDNMTVSADEDACFHTRDVGLTKALIRVDGKMTLFQLEKFLEMFAQDTYRIKGFLTLRDGGVFVDCVGPQVVITPLERFPGADGVGLLVSLAGPGLPMQKSLKQAAEWYPGLVTIEK